MIFRLVWFIAVLVTAATGPLALFLVCGLSYLFYYMGIELLMVSFLVDSYFGYGYHGWPLYTFGTLALLLVVQFSRPYISLYTR